MQTETNDCFTCGRSTCGRFCGDRCREAFDAGWPAYEPSASRKLYTAPWRVVAGAGTGFLPQPMRPGSTGFFIDCCGCGKEFESKGLAYCGPQCRSAHHERQDNAKLMANAGIEPATKRACEECGQPITRWRNGRAVSKATRFCSPACQDKSARKRRNALRGLSGGFAWRNAKEVAENKGAPTVHQERLALAERLQ